MTPVMTFARIASGERIVITPDQRCVHERPEERGEREREDDRGDGQLEREREDRQGERDERRRSEAQRLVAPDELHGDEAAEHGTDAERREEGACDPRAGVLLVGEHRETGGEHLPEAVREEGSDTEHAKRPIAQHVADPREHPLAVVALRQRRAMRDEEQQQREREEEGRGVHVEDDRRAEGRDQDPRGGRAEKRGRAPRAFHERVRLSDDLLVVADELRQDRAPARRSTAR